MKVLFICKFNVGRSQMAEAFYNKLSKNGHAISAGVRNYYYRTIWHSRIKPSDPVVKVMHEEGIDLARKRIKKLTRSMVESADDVIALMSEDEAEKCLPKYVRESKKYKLWQMKDVSGSTAYNKALGMHRANRNRIKRFVKKLIKEEI